MNVAIIGRSELMYNTALLLLESGFNIPLIVTAKEAPEYKVSSADFKNLAEKTGAVFINTAKINEYETYSLLSSLKEISVSVSVNYSGIIDQRIIDLFPVGILNAHGGDLPRYRGNACQAWAIINGEEKVGLCIHKMIGGELDSGDIVARDYYQLKTSTRVGEIYSWMENRIPQLFLEALEKLKDNNQYVLEVQSKDPKDALRCYPRNPSDGRVCWEKSSIEILRLINASSEPFSGAFGMYEGKEMRIWRAELHHDEERYLAVPGQVAEINKSDGSVMIITGNGKIKITEIEYEGHRVKPAEVITSIRKRLK
ncbi:MAG: methionyl-tRNA formyltransferase [Ignavibacteriales bacterium]